MCDIVHGTIMNTTVKNEIETKNGFFKKFSLRQRSLFKPEIELFIYFLLFTLNDIE
jgi:hypothetical protein